MALYKLIYFPVRGRGEAIRYLLKDNELPHEEETVTGAMWPELKPKMAFGQLPALKAGDLELVQSNAILRYLARKHGLYGSNDEEATKIDMINDGQEDLRLRYVHMIYTNYENGKEDFIKSLPEFFERYEKFLKMNNEGDGFMVGSKISFADYNVFDLLDNLVVLSPDCLDSFPKLKAYYERISARPGMAAYRQTDAFKNRKINGNDKQ